MAARLTDKRKKKIIADYIEVGSYNAVAKMNGVSNHTVKRVVESSPDLSKKIQDKKQENTADILAYMQTKKDTVNKIIDVYLQQLLNPETISKATPSQLTTALGTLIDKFTAIKPFSGNSELEDDPLTQALKEEAEKIQNGKLQK